MPGLRSTYTRVGNLDGIPERYKLNGRSHHLDLCIRNEQLGSGAINGIPIENFVTNAFEDTRNITKYWFVSIDYPPQFNDQGLPVNYNDDLVIEIQPGGLRGGGTLKSVYFDPDQPASP